MVRNEEEGTAEKGTAGESHAGLRVGEASPSPPRACCGASFFLPVQHCGTGGRGPEPSPADIIQLAAAEK